MNQIICKFSDLTEGVARGYTVSINNQATELIIIAIDGSVFAYHNRCPHIGVSLDWMPDEFMDISGKLLQCSTHGALFRPKDGFCLRGPCAGSSLSPVNVAVIDGEIQLVD